MENERIVADHTVVGRMFLTGDGDYTLLVCDNKSNAERLWGSTSRSSFPKDGINDHVIHGAQTVNPAQVGTKAALHYVLSVDAGETCDDQASIRPPRRPMPPSGRGSCARAAAQPRPTRFTRA